MNIFNISATAQVVTKKNEHKMSINRVETNISNPKRALKRPQTDSEDYTLCNCRYLFGILYSSLKLGSLRNTRLTICPVVNQHTVLNS
jgi:hypothetical protein